MSKRKKNVPSRLGVIRDPAMYAAWSKSHPVCLACGRSNFQSRKDFFGLALSTHHIIKFRRSDEPTNLLRLCDRCHSSAEGLILPKLTIGICMSLKKARDPSEYDPDRLRALYGFGRLEEEPIPWALEEEFRRRQPKRPEIWSNGPFSF